MQKVKNPLREQGADSVKQETLFNKLYINYSTAHRKKVAHG